MFEDLLSYGYFLKIWRTAGVVTILKNEDKERDNPKSYRPVSLLPVLRKTLEHIMGWIDRHVTVSSELARTRGIRLSN